LIQKTRKSIAKRFKVTKTGKVLRRSTGMRHLKVKKSKSRKRRQKAVKKMEGRVAKKIKKIL